MCIDPLTSPLSLLFIPDDTENTETLARVLSALYIAQSSLDSYMIHLIRILTMSQS